MFLYKLCKYIDIPSVLEIEPLICNYIFLMSKLKIQTYQ